MPPFIIGLVGLVLQFPFIPVHKRWVTGVRQERLTFALSALHFATFKEAGPLFF